MTYTIDLKRPSTKYHVSKYLSSRSSLSDLPELLRKSRHGGLIALVVSPMETDGSRKQRDHGSVVVGV
jgi:hypothetical protein